MSLRPPVPRLLVITDPSLLSPPALLEVLDRVLDAVPPGSVGVYHRVRSGSDRQALAEARALAARCRAGGRGAPLLVRARVDLALAAEADGVQLQADGLRPAEVRAVAPGLRVGYSAHAVDEVVRVAPEVDFLTFSPVYASPGKGPPVGTAVLAAACRAAGGTPVLGLGGVVEPAQAAACRAAGAFGVAVIRGVLGAPEPAAAAAAIVACLPVG